MSYQKPAYQILAAADAIEDPDARAVFLKTHWRGTLSTVLACIHNPDIIFDSFSKLEYSTKLNRAGVSDSTLDHEMRRIYIFEKSAPLPKERKRARLVQILEGLYAEEAALLFECMIKKNNVYKNINKNFIKKYFPIVLTTNLAASRR